MKEENKKNISKCEYCGSTQADMFNPCFFYGFYDEDMKISVCYDCKRHHYNKKNEILSFKHIKNETPIKLNIK